VVRGHGTEKRNPYFRGKGCAGMFASNEPYLAVAEGHDKLVPPYGFHSNRRSIGCKGSAGPLRGS
jgi:hypothetical protein